MNKLFSVILMLTLLLGGCATGGRPDWADGGKSKTYPENRYLTGVGTATELETAKDRARANLAKFFSVKTDDVKAGVARTVGKADAGLVQYINQSRVEQLIRNRTRQVLTGARIAETWQGPETKAYYALAIQPRLQASNNLKQEIVRLDNATRGYVRRSKTGGDILKQVRAASVAVDAQVARLGYQGILQKVDASDRGTSSDWDIKALIRDLERLLRRVRIAPLVADDPTGTLRTSTSAALSTTGFEAGDGTTAEFILDTRLELENIGYKDKWFWSRGVLVVTLRERVTGKERGNVRWAIKAAGHSTGDAEQRIATKADALLKRQLRETIIKFAVR